MKSFGRVLTVAAACTAAPCVSHAADGTVTITGIVTSETCAINGGSSSFTVTLPKVSSATLGVAGATAGRTPFSLALTGCNFGAGPVYPYFEAGSTINAAGRLVNSGGATNLDIELLNGSAQVMNLAATVGNQSATVANVSGNAATLAFYAQYRATGAVAAGTVSSSVTYTIVYP